MQRAMAGSDQRDRWTRISSQSQEGDGQPAGLNGNRHSITCSTQRLHNSGLDGSQLTLGNSQLTLLL